MLPLPPFSSFEARDLAGLPMVRLSIALDVGDVMVGVVGDESQMEPTTLSTGTPRRRCAQ